MQPNELRIRNYVNWGIKICTITGIHTRNIGDDKNIEHFYVSGIIGDYYVVFPEDISPIPLTEQWFNRFEFNEDGFKQYEGSKLGMFAIKSPSDGYILFQGYLKKWLKNELTSVRYVHQLQNIYFALTGEELPYVVQHPQPDPK